MANGYSRMLSLADIYNNKKLAGVLPLVNYKETQLDNGKTSARTSATTVTTLVYNTAVKSGGTFYKPYTPSRSSNTIVISGTLTDSIDTAHNAVYEAILGIVPMIKMTANYTDMIRSAMKEAGKSQRKGKSVPKLALRVGSVEEISKMSAKQLNSFMSNVIENIMFDDAYSETQKKYNVSSMNFGNSTYEYKKYLWNKRVGKL